ncbi:hypothetical protein BVY04_04720 [bacterium M21]|nr:hypothetical protein BVY04_04720 [bacterium M21]
MFPLFILHTSYFIFHIWSIMNTPPQIRLVESRARLSESVIWDQQNRHLADLGADAWKTIANTKPAEYYTYLADLYADLIIGLMRDIIRRHPRRKETFEILELGSASGHFAWLFCKVMDQRLTDLSFDNVDYRLTLSDPHQACQKCWSQQPQLQPFVESGKLNWSEECRAGQSSPLIVIANGHFSTLAADAFYIENGTLYENRLTVEAKQIDEGEDLDYYYDPIPFQKSEVGELLELYPAAIKDGTFTIPIAALATIEELKTQAKDEIILLTADTMYLTPDAMYQRPADNLFTKGLISTPLNAHAFTHILRAQDWHSLVPETPANPFQTMASICSKHDWPELDAAWTRNNTPRTLDDSINLCRAFTNSEQPTIRQLLSLFRLCHNNPAPLTEYVNILKAQLPKATATETKLLTQTLDALWQNTYRNGQGPDIAFELAKLYFQLEDIQTAAIYLHHSIDDYGESTDSCYNLALCYKQLGRLDESSRWLKKSTLVDPEYEPARQLIEQLQEV